MNETFGQWAPFLVAENQGRGDPPRSLDSPDGVGDRLRTAAFAEVQARDAFLWAAGFFTDAPESASPNLAGARPGRTATPRLALPPHGRVGRGPRCPQSVGPALAFATVVQISRGVCDLHGQRRGTRPQSGGERFHQALVHKDPVTAEIFRKIAGRGGWSISRSPRGTIPRPGRTILSPEMSALRPRTDVGPSIAMLGSCGTGFHTVARRV